MRALQGAAVVAMILAAGCGDDAPTLAPAGGTVLFNGEPLAKANVVFIPEESGPSSVGQTGDDGRFTLLTGGESGAVVGKHQVAIQAVEDAELNEAGEVEGAVKSRIPEKYSNHLASGLSAEVKQDGENNFSFELTGPAPRR